MSEASATIKDYIDQGKNFEVKFEGDSPAPVICEPKGISKIVLSKDEIAKAKIKKSAGRKVVKCQKEFIMSAADALVGNKVGFKVTFGSGESVIRFDLDHYLRLFQDKDKKSENCTVLGFSSLDERPIGFIKEQISTYPNVKLLAPRK